MRYSPEALMAFVEAADAGSFSAAARKLRKSQSTVSTAIANLEVDLGVTLFDRQSRHPVLTPAGQRVLSHVQAILAASERLDELAVRLSTQVETRLTFVLSDTYQPTHHEALLRRFERRYPDIEFECQIAEDQDVIDLLQSGRAHIGMVEVQKSYPPDIGVARLPEQTDMSIFAAKPIRWQRSHNCSPSSYLPSASCVCNLTAAGKCRARRDRSGLRRAI